MSITHLLSGGTGTSGSSPIPNPHLISHQSFIAYSHSHWLRAARGLQTQTPLVSREVENEADRREYMCSASGGTPIFQKLKTLLATHSVVILALNFVIPHVRWHHLL